MRTTIRKTSDRFVSLTRDDYYTDKRVTIEYFCPPGGGYVREWGYQSQICELLMSRGSTLSVEKEEDLLPLIRSEHAKSMRQMT